MQPREQRAVQHRRERPRRTPLEPRLRREEQPERTRHDDGPRARGVSHGQRDQLPRRRMTREVERRDDGRAQHRRQRRRPGERRRQRQRERLARWPGVQWIDRLPDDFEGVVLANEVMDVIPVYPENYGAMIGASHMGGDLCAKAEAMGYKLAILPGLMIKAAIEAGDAALAELKATHMAPPVSASVSQTFKRFGADEWDALRRCFNVTTGVQS